MNKEENALALALEKRANKIGALDAYQNAQFAVFRAERNFGKGWDDKTASAIFHELRLLYNKANKEYNESFWEMQAARIG